jgi:hypothetical protein
LRLALVVRCIPPTAHCSQQDLIDELTSTYPAALSVLARGLLEGSGHCKRYLCEGSCTWSCTRAKGSLRHMSRSEIVRLGRMYVQP